MLKDINLNELTLENIGSWPLQVKIIAISACCFMLILLCYWFDIRGQLSELDARKNAERELLQQINAKYQLAVNFPAYKSQLNMMRQSFKLMLQALPGKTEVPNLLEDITKAGIASGLEFRSFKPLPEQKAEFYMELPIEIAVIGNYHQLGQFVSKVSSLNRIVTLHNYTIENLPLANGERKSTEATALNEKLLMSIIAKTYRYAEEAASSSNTTVTVKH